MLSAVVLFRRFFCMVLLTVALLSGAPANASTAAVSYTFESRSSADTNRVDTPGTDLVVPPDGGQTAPNCGTLYVTERALYYGPVEVGSPIRGIEFRVVGVDLGQWLGYPAGLGTLQVYVTTQSSGTDYKGTFSASTQSGARTGIIQAPWVPGQSNPTVKGFIEKSGKVKCKQTMIVYPPGAGPA